MKLQRTLQLLLLALLLCYRSVGCQQTDWTDDTDWTSRDLLQDGIVDPDVEDIDVDATSLFTPAATLAPAALPQECKASAGTTNQCTPNCQRCIDAPGKTARTRPCACCKAGAVPHPTAAARCNRCPRGTTAAMAGSKTCKKCPRGLSTLTIGSSRCNSCPPGTELVMLDVIIKGTTKKVASCRGCAAGFVSKGGDITTSTTTAKCAPCEEGKTTLGSLRTRCTACSPGYGGRICTKCLPGRYSPGGPIGAACKACPQGTSTTIEGATSCEPVIPIPGPKFTANITVITSGTCNATVADALADTIKTSVLAATPPASQGSVTVTKLACANAPEGTAGRRLLQTGARYGFTAGSADLDSLKQGTDNDTLVPKLNETVQNYSQTLSGFDVSYGGPQTSPSPDPQTNLPSPSPKPQNTTAVSPSPKPQNTTAVSPSPKPQPSPSPEPEIPNVPQTCGSTGYKCSSGVLKSNIFFINVPASGGTDELCCTTCTSYSCPAGEQRSSPLLLAGVTSSYRVCCDACATYNCDTLAKRTPGPQIESTQVSEDLCCVVPPVKVPVVTVDVQGSSSQCNDTENELIRQQVYVEITDGRTTQDAAKIKVDIGKCEEVTTGNRRLSGVGRELNALQQVVIVELIITVNVNESATAAEVSDATRILIDALGPGISEQLPPSATLADLVGVLTDIATNNATELLETVNEAISNAGLGSVFTNATAVNVETQALSCTGKPSALGIAWDNCSGTAVDGTCLGSCDSNRRRVFSTCQSSGDWSAVAGDCTVVTQKSCTGSPPAIQSAIWPGPRCTGKPFCPATCTGNTTGSPLSSTMPIPFSWCNTETGNWMEVQGQCAPIRCVDPIVATVVYAFWPAVCPSNTVGSKCSATCVGTGTAPYVTCTRSLTFPGNTAYWDLTNGTCTDNFKINATCADADGASPFGTPRYPCGTDSNLKPSPETRSIAGNTSTEAQTICCDALYSSTATCSSATCPSGYQAKTGVSGTLINGLIIGGSAFTTRCCDPLYPTGATCNDVDGPGGSSTNYTCPGGYKDKTNFTNSIFNLTETGAISSCCDQLYAPGATCGSAAYNCTSTGYDADPSIGIAGRTQAEASPLCCTIYRVGATCNDTDAGGFVNPRISCFGTGYDKDPSFDTLPVNGKNLTAATTACCTVLIPVFPAGATCGDSQGNGANTAFACGTGYTARSGVNGTGINGQTDDYARFTCCELAKQAVFTQSAILPMQWDGQLPGAYSVGGSPVLLRGYYSAIADGTFNQTIPDRRWWLFYFTEAFKNGVKIGKADYGITDLAAEVAGTTVVNASVGSNLFSSAPVNPATNASITKAMKLMNTAGSDGTMDMLLDSSRSGDRVHISYAFPGTKPGEVPGMFNGVKWMDFITGGGSFEYSYYKANWTGSISAGAPTLRIVLVNPGLLPASYAEFLRPVQNLEWVYEPYNQPGQGSGPPVNQWLTESLNYTTGGVWVVRGLRPGNSTVDSISYGNYNIKWWMESPAAALNASWTASGIYPNFMQDAVIYEISMTLRTNAEVLGYFGQLRARYQDWDWTWNFA